MGLMLGFVSKREPNVRIATIEDVRYAEQVIRQHISSTPLIRSYALERELKFAKGRRVWLKDYGWTPVGSFKLMGALNWMAKNLERIGPFFGQLCCRHFVRRPALRETRDHRDARYCARSEI